MSSPPSLFVHHYTNIQLQHLPSPIKFVFATSPSISSQSLSHVHNLPKLPPLRASPTFSSFSVYPTSNHSLPVNHLLWTIANECHLHPPTADPLLGAHVFALGFSPELHSFLISFTLEEIDRAIIDFLVLLHHKLTVDQDHEGLHRLMQDLLPEIWHTVRSNIGHFPEGKPTRGKRALALERLVQISFMTPWRVDVFGAYFSAVDVANIAACGSTDVGSVSASGDVDGHCTGIAISKLYDDWKVYRRLLCNGAGLSSQEALEAMDCAVHSGRSKETMHMATEIGQLGRTKGSWFEKLPHDLVDSKIVGWVVRQHCEQVSPRECSQVNLKNLLKISNECLEELTMDLLLGEFQGFEDGNELTNAGVSIDDRVGLGVGVRRLFDEAGLSEDFLVEEEESEELETYDDESELDEGGQLHHLDPEQCVMGEENHWSSDTSTEVNTGRSVLIGTDCVETSHVGSSSFIAAYQAES